MDACFKKERGHLKTTNIGFFDIDCWRHDQIRYQEFLNDLKLINKFIATQAKNNPDFSIEIIAADPISDPRYINGVVNLIVAKSSDGLNGFETANKKSHSFKDVLSLNTTLIMTGFCMGNDRVKSNTSLYGDVALSNFMGAWGFMEEAANNLYWVLPTDWDKLDAPTRRAIHKNYEASENTAD